MSELEIEKRLRTALHEQLVAQEAERLCRRYQHAKDKMFLDVLPYIRGTEPNLTDHSGPHIDNVLSNACRLLEAEEVHSLDLYLLCQSILFHDAGNVRGRTDHQKRVGEAYAYAYQGSENDPQERRLITTIAAAHTGTAASGSTDTLQALGETDQYLGRVVHPRAIAATLRFADELAEGPQRTSAFAIEQGLFDDVSTLFHVYAMATRVTIDKQNSRVALDYDIDVHDDSGSLKIAKEIALSDLLAFSYGRIAKLDTERKYTKHYCNWLSGSKSIHVRIHLTCNDYSTPVKTLTFQMTDLILPNTSSEKLECRYPELVIQELEDAVRRCLNQEASYG